MNLNLCLNIYVIITGIIFLLTFFLVRTTYSDKKQSGAAGSDQWYIKIAYKILALNIVLISTILSQPFLMVNLPVITCLLYTQPLDQATEGGECFGENNMIIFVLNLAA